MGLMEVANPLENATPMGTSYSFELSTLILLMGCAHKYNIHEITAFEGAPPITRDLPLKGTRLKEAPSLKRVKVVLICQLYRVRLPPKGHLPAKAPLSVMGVLLQGALSFEEGILVSPPP